MNVARIQSGSPSCCDIFSPCSFFVTIPKRFFLFLRDIFLSIAATFSTPPKEKIRVVETIVGNLPDHPVLVPAYVQYSVSHHLTTEVEEDGITSESPEKEEIIEEKSVASVVTVITPEPERKESPEPEVLVTALESVPAPQVLSHKEGMLLAMGELIHPDMARIFESLLIGLDVITSWNYNEGDGSYKIEMSQIVKVWVPKGDDPDAPNDGTIVQFGPEVSGKFVRSTKTIHFNKGFVFECRVWFLLTLNVSQITYCTDSGMIKLTVGMLGTYRDKLKRVDQQITDWGKIENRR